MGSLTLPVDDLRGLHLVRLGFRSHLLNLRFEDLMQSICTGTRKAGGMAPPAWTFHGARTVDTPRAAPSPR